jgi:4-amino-4-deoxy-L-arabinose transferase-like glycosyltransferase
MSTATVPATGGVTRRARDLRAGIGPRHLGLLAVLALSAVLNVKSLSQNGWANSFYSASAKSMLQSWHNFFFVSFDPGGMVSVDKPPLAMWLQAASAKVFGLSSWSLLLPEAICGVAAVLVLYRIVRPRFGTEAALLSALALAVFPSLVAVSRDNNPDALLILLLTLSAGAAIRACENGRWRSLIWCAVLVGLAFNTKMLAGWLVVPALALAYLVCAPGGWRRRIAQLVVAGLVMAAVSFAWLTAVDLTPKSDRPYVGSSSNNSAFGLAFGYNGFGRVEGQLGGPGGTGGGAGRGGFGGGVRAAGAGATTGQGAVQGLFGTGAGAAAGGGAATPGAGGGAATPGAGAAAPGGGGFPGGGTGGPPGGFTGGGRGGGGPGGGNSAFGGPTGPLRLFSQGIGDQGGWMLPFAFVSILAIALTLTRRRTDPRLAGLIVFGGWFLTEAVVFSFSKGIIHPYYVSALGPSSAALVGIGAVAMVQLVKRRDWRLIVPAVAIGLTVWTQIVLLDRAQYLEWWIPALIAGAVLAFGAAILLRRWAMVAIAALLGVLLLAPGVYASTVWDGPVSGTFPAAGPTSGGGGGGFGGGLGQGGGDSSTAALATYLRTHDPGTRWQIIVQTSNAGAPLILDEGISAGSMGGFNGDDKALTADQLAGYVQTGEARYVQVGSSFPGRGGNDASSAVQSACTEVPASAYGGTTTSTGGFGGGRGGGTLYDCRGAEAKLRAAG